MAVKCPIMGAGRSQCASAALVNPEGFETFDYPGWGTAVTGPSGRRPSTVTVGSVGEDAFTRHLQRYDPVSSERALQWSFRRDVVDGVTIDARANTRRVHGADAAGARATIPGAQETWRQAHVGRFRVDRHMVKRELSSSIGEIGFTPDNF